MNATLKGTLYGATRAEIVKQAAATAATYFGTECVVVELDNERPYEEPLFAADFRAEVWHALERRSYGPDRCRRCNRDSWPHNPLNKDA